ncbi:MAG: hypothetical protein R2818_14765 [Flavobacteriales bacterium]
MNTGVRTIVQRVLITLLLVALTFPRLDITTDIGVDNSLAWAFNHLFATGLDQAAHLVFPHGPLAFLMYPQALGGELGAAYFAIVAILGTFIFMLLTLGAGTDPERLVWHALLIALLATLVQVHMQLMGITAVGLVLHWRNASKGALAVAVVAAVLALHVRASIGIISCTFLFTHAILLLWRRKDFRTVLSTTIAFIAWLILLRPLLYGSFTGIWTSFAGLFELSRASSAATSLYPANNWWALGTAIVLFLAIPIFRRDREVRHLYVLFALALFAAWKHGITREDVYHARGFYVFLLLFFGILLLAVKRWPASNVMVMGAVMVFGYLALAPTLLYGDHQVHPFGVNRAYEWTFERDAMKARAEEVSRRNLEPERLPADIATLLKAGTVDVYPWELSYIPANDLHWQPRPVPQSYASYTPWLDARNAEHFTGARAPDRILWHFVDDRWGGRMASVDERYLLNDEPRTILAILNNYAWTVGTDRVAVLERSPGPRLGASTTIGQSSALWNTWVEVPAAEEGILRAKVQVKGTLYGAMKDFIYKDALYTVRYRLDDGSTRSYRFVPASAAEGIWVAPFIQHPERPTAEPRVVAIRFECSALSMVQDELPLEWELTPLAETPDAPPNAEALFGKGGSHGMQRILATRFDTEGNAPGWQWDESTRTDRQPHSGNAAVDVKAEGFSPAFVLPLDTLQGPLLISASGWLRAAAEAKVAFVITVESSTGMVFWDAVDAHDMLQGPDRWSRVMIERGVEAGPDRVLKVYLWNKGKLPVLVDDLAVELWGARR